MKISAIRIPCSKLSEASEYYSNLVGWQKAFGSEEEGFIGFKLGEVTVLLEPEEPGEFEAGSYLGFSVAVADIQQYYEAARTRGVEFTAAPKKQPWGGVMTHIQDCSGNTFTVIEASES